MTSRRYLNFDLLLEQEADGQYQALVTGSPLGETPSVRFKLPFDATTLENLLLKLDPGRSGTRRVGGTSQQQATMDFGGPLYSAIFRDDLLLAWSRSQDMARQQDAGLRLRLRLKDAPAISGLPWELLYDAKSNNFLAQSERTPLVRFLDVPEVPRPMAVDGPLRVLVIISSPTDLDELDVEAEWQRIGEALAPRVASGLVVVDRLPTATIADLGAWLRRHPTHVIHFVGHGDFDDRLREGVVYFQDEHGRSSPVTSSVLGPYLRDHDPLRMVVLNACRSARTDAVDPFGGIAQGLVQQDATAVVAMQFPISDRAAVTFTGEFYGALVDGLPVDQAVSSARKALQAEFRDEWATPVLFLRSPDGNIFENVHADPGVVPAPPPGHGPTPPPPPPPPPPHPSPVAELVRWVREHAVVVGIVAAALVAAVVLLVWSPWSGGDEGPVADPVDPADLLELPQSEPLTATQMLVAAGKGPSSLNIWLVDTQDPTATKQISTGLTREWLPVLSPDRRTVIYSRGKPDSRDYELWTAAALDGSDERPLFDLGVPDECAKSTGRPAWVAHTDQLVLRCFAADGHQSLLRVDVHGRVLQTYDVVDGSGNTQNAFSDPTVSPDKRTIVVWGNPDAGAEGGSLFAIDFKTGDSQPLLVGEGEQFSDAVFSFDGNALAWRDATGSVTGFDVMIASFRDNVLGDPRNLTTSVAGKDQDPSFSSNGQQIVYGHVDVGQEGKAQQLWVVNSKGFPDAIQLEVGTLPTFASVAAWSRR